MRTKHFAAFTFAAAIVAGASFATVTKDAETSIALTRPATEMELDGPTNIAIGPSDVLYIVTTGGALYRMDLASGILAPLLKEQRFGAGAVQVSGDGKVLTADYARCQIISIDPKTSVVETVAGIDRDDDGKCESKGDGGPATQASFLPNSLTLDASGNIYIDDVENQRVRRIDARTRIISTVAGTGVVGSKGDGGPGTSAQLNYPFSVAVDAEGTLYIGQAGTGPQAHAIRRIDGHSGVITTLQSSEFHDGNPTSVTLPEPQYVFCDSTGNLYVLDTARIYYIDFKKHKISILAGTKQGFGGDGGPARAAEFYFPASVAFDSKGNLYIADWANNRIRKIDARTQIVTTVAGNGEGPPPPQFRIVSGL